MSKVRKSLLIFVTTWETDLCAHLWPQRICAYRWCHLYSVDYISRRRKIKVHQSLDMYLCSDEKINKGEADGPHRILQKSICHFVTLHSRISRWLIFANEPFLWLTNRPARCELCTKVEAGRWCHRGTGDFVKVWWVWSSYFITW